MKAVPAAVMNNIQAIKLKREEIHPPSLILIFQIIAPRHKFTAAAGSDKEQ